MKTLLFLLLITAVATISQGQKRTFLRIFNEEGKKTEKGFLTALSASGLTILTEEKKEVIVPITEIHTIKLKRSFGHTVMITSLIAAGACGILGAASADPDAWIFGYSAAEGALMGITAGAAGGIALGSIISGTINRPVFNVQKNPENWNKVRDVLTRYLPRKNKHDGALATNF
jgi:hypothetical protein